MFRVHIVIDPPSCGQAIHSFTSDRGKTFAWAALRQFWKLLEIVKETVEVLRNYRKSVETVRTCGEIMEMGEK